MKKYVLSTILLTSSICFTANGALLVRKNVTIHQSATPSIAGTATVAKVATTTTKRASLLASGHHKSHFRNLGELPKGVYIAMCILPLGWLAIAINSNFTENEWIFALLWYVLLYFPGVYYSLRQMRRFYGR